MYVHGCILEMECPKVELSVIELEFLFILLWSKPDLSFWPNAAFPAIDGRRKIITGS